MAERGADTLMYGPMKPVGLTDPHRGERPYAVVQLRQDNKEDTLRNMVGFQTKLKHSEQTRIFRTIPGLENAVSPVSAVFIKILSSSRPSCWMPFCG